MTTTSKRILRTKKAPLSKRKCTIKTSRYISPERSDESDAQKPLTAVQIEAYSKFIVPEKVILTRHDKAISALNDRALKAFQEEDQELFVKIISKTKSLYVRDDAVRLAAEVGWIEVAEQLLIRETSDVYEYPEGSASLSQAFAQFSDECTVEDLNGRWLLKTAVQSAVKNNREAVFNLLAPVVGVDFTDLCSGDLFRNVADSQMDSNTKKKWMRLIAGYVNEETSRLRLENAIYHCAGFQLVERLPYLLDCLFSISKDPSPAVMAALSTAIEKHHQKVARCIIDKLRIASIPISKISMYIAEDKNNIEMVLYLCQNGCSSFPLEVFGKNRARRLRQLLSRNNHDDAYNLIVSE